MDENEVLAEALGLLRTISSDENTEVASMEGSVKDGKEGKGHPFARISVEVRSSAAEILAFPGTIDSRV